MNEGCNDPPDLCNLFYDGYTMNKNSELVDILKDTIAFSEDHTQDGQIIQRFCKLLDGKYIPPYRTICPQISDIAEYDTKIMKNLEVSICRIMYAIDRIAESDSEYQKRYGYAPGFKQTFYVFSNSLIQGIDYEIAKIQLNNQIEQLKKDQDELTKRIQKFETDIQEEKEDICNISKSTKNELDKNKIDSILILSIFSAIALTFTGGLGFIGSALSSIGDAPLSELIIVILLIGIIIIVTISILLFCISKIINKKEQK